MNKPVEDKNTITYPNYLLVNINKNCYLFKNSMYYI